MKEIRISITILLMTTLKKVKHSNHLKMNLILIIKNLLKYLIIKKISHVLKFHMDK